MPREAYSSYRFICDYCGMTRERTDDPNPPGDWYELEDFKLSKDYLYLCNKCGGTLKAMLDLLQIHYEPIGQRIKILSTISRTR